MPRLALGYEEWFPIQILAPSDGANGYLAEFSDEELADLQRVGREFEAWQDKISKRFGIRRGERGIPAKGSGGPPLRFPKLIYSAANSAGSAAPSNSDGAGST